ncbi:MAG: hypothetical protein ACP5VR_03315 [Acidimicrobiales bacterium]
MATDQAAVVAAYLEHLSDSDLLLLTGQHTGHAYAAQLRDHLRSGRGDIAELLASNRVYHEVFSRGQDPLLNASPFLVFSVAVEQVVRELRSATHITEQTGPHRGAVVFDVERLREFASAPWVRLFLAELLASFTRVASGSVLVPSRHGWRRQRFSELDPVRLAGLLDVVTEAERPGILRRLGDLALFLTGVFPGYVAREGFGPVAQARLFRAATPLRRDEAPMRRGPAPVALHDTDAVSLLEQLGRRWYEAAVKMVPAPVPANVAVLSQLPEHFSDARRILSIITDRFLYPSRGEWFGLGTS